MNRTVLTESSSRRSRSMLWVFALLIVVAVMGLTWMLVQDGRSTVVADEVAAGPAMADRQRVAALQPGAEPRAADAFSAELDLLRRQTAIVASRDAATAYALSLETLAQAGRQAFLDNRLPTTANGYVDYLDSLRRQGQAVQNAGGAPADANAFSAWLDELRRMGQ